MGWFKKSEKKPAPPPPRVEDVITIHKRGITVTGLAYEGPHVGWVPSKVYFPETPALQDQGDETMCVLGKQRAVALCPLDDIVEYLNSRE